MKMPHSLIPRLYKDEADTRSEPEKKVDLEKQSQFAVVQLGAKSYIRRNYGNIPAGGCDENKANQSQFQTPALPKEVGKGEKLPGAATG
jgi:hypothetical protein